ncbi:MAG: FtsQ-type POTRA domain-containing protein [Acidimicrobiales bacterium]|nr:FtsQ-type POTRA domain-containing protein [Acidimicrobiales bacterium]
MTAPSSPGLAGGGGDVVVDPRLGARRRAVRHVTRDDPDRRRLYRLILLILVAILALGIVIVLESPILDVDRIDIAGARATEPAAITEVAGISIGSPLLLADLDAAESRVEALPWIEEATVERDLPGGVHIDVVERTPAALVAGGGSTVLVGTGGRVLSGDPAEIPPAVDTSPGFVRVDVGDEPPAVGERIDPALAEAVTLAERLRADPAGAVQAVQLAPLRFELTDGATVELGDASALPTKLEAFRTLYARVDRSCPVATIDLRVPERPVLTREEPCS